MLKNNGFKIEFDICEMLGDKGTRAEHSSKDLITDDNINLKYVLIT